MGQVVQLAHSAGWAVRNVRAAWTEKGWRTPELSDGVGFPDLTLVKPGCPILFRELKSDTGRLNANQEAWGNLIQKAGGDWAVWRPRDIELVCDELGVAVRTVA
jgi:hypothetical protein